MTDDDFLINLENCRLDPATFDHKAHIRAGYLYLRRHEFIDAVAAMRRAIKAFAAAIGKDGLYHETVTVAFMTLINERLSGEVPTSDWPTFALANNDLFTGSPLTAYYSKERLASPLARRIFLLPDRGTGTTERDAA